MKRVGELLKLGRNVYPRSVPERLRAGYDERAAALLEIATDLNRVMDAAESDTHLTGDGRNAAGEKAATVALSAIEKWDAPVVTLFERVKTGTEAMLRKAGSGYGRPSDPAERVAYELKLGEIRAELRPLDPIKRAAVYQATEDPLVLAAIEGAPPSLVQSDAGTWPAMRPFVEPDRVAARRLERGRALDPSGAAELDELGGIAELYRMLGNGLREEILAAFPAVREAAPFVDPRTGKAIVLPDGVDPRTGKPIILPDTVKRGGR